MKKQFLSLGLMLLSGVAMAQTSQWTQSFNAVSGQSFNRIAMFQGVNDNPDGPDFIVNSLFTVGQTQHSQVGSNVFPAAAQPRYSFGGNAFSAATAMNGVKATGYDVYPDPTIDQFYDEVWLAGHKITGPAIQAQYSTGTIQKRTLWLENTFTEIRALANCQYNDISINKIFGGQGIVAVGNALVENQAFVSTSTDNGVSWTDYEHTTTESALLRAVKYASEDVIYAVGGYTTGTAAPLVLKSTDGGANWVELTVGISGIGMLRDLSTVSADELWAVGADGKIIHSDNGGTSWSEQTSGTSNDLVSVCFLDSQKGWASGGAGTIRKTNNGGQTWTVSSINSTLDLMDIAFVSENEGVVIALNGTIFSFVGCSPITGNVTIDGPSSICADGEATYTIQVGQQNADEYAWSYNGQSGTFTGSLTITAPSEGQGNPALTVYGINECSQGTSFSYSPSVVGTPDPFTITAPATVCVGYLVSISVESTGVPVTWQMPAGWVQVNTFPNNNGGFFNAGEAGTISFIRDNGCFTRTETHEIAVATSVPAPPVLAEGAQALCKGEATLFTFNADPNAASTTIQGPSSFSTGGWISQADTDTSIYITPMGSLNGPFNITAYSTNACGNSSNTLVPITSSPNPLSGYATISPYNDVFLAGGNYEGIVTFQWLLEGEPIEGATERTHIPLVSGNYSLQVEFVNFDCGTEVSSSVYVEVTITGVDENGASALSIYPTPTSSAFTMDGLTTGSTITVMDAMGRTVRSTAVSASRMEVSVADLSTGIYMVQVMDGNDMRTARLVVN